MEDLISIIIPAYNAEKYIEECIESIISQTYKKLEIVIVDDGSNDNTLRICNKYSKKDNRIKVIHIENSGVSNARNIGLKEIKGEYVTFVDADDYIDKSFCFEMLRAIKENDSDCCACSYNRVYKNKIEEKPFNRNGKISGEQFFNEIFDVQSGMGFSNMKLWKKKSIEKIRFNNKIVVAEDALFSMQASENIKSIYLIDKQLYNYRSNQNSAVRKFDTNYIKKYLNAMIVTKEYLKKNNKENSKRFSNYVVYHVLLIIINYCYNPNNYIKKSERRKCLKKVCNIDEFKYAIKHSNYKGFSITRKITLFTLKHHLYFITEIIGSIRQRQIQK